MDRQAIEKLQADYAKYQKLKRIRRWVMFVMIVVILVVVFASNEFSFGTETAQVIKSSCAVGTTEIKTKSEHIKTRQKLKDIADVKTFDELLERCMLTDEEKYILRQHYYKGRSFQSIAMEINISEDWLKHRHQKILRKLQKLL